MAIQIHPQQRALAVEVGMGGLGILLTHVDDEERQFRKFAYEVDIYGLDLESEAVMHYWEDKVDALEVQGTRIIKIMTVAISAYIDIYKRYTSDGELSREERNYLRYALPIERDPELVEERLYDLMRKVGPIFPEQINKLREDLFREIDSPPEWREGYF